MTRTGNCIVNLFHVNNYLHFLKEASKLNPLLVHQILPKLSIKVTYSAYKCTQNGYLNGTPK
jgi:hypothetical protein